MAIRSSQTLHVHIQILISFVIYLIILGESTVDANVKKVLLQLPKKPKPVHHHHHYLVMDPIAGATQIGRLEHTLPRPSMGPNPTSHLPSNMRPFHAELGLPYHGPTIYLGHPSDPHSAIIEQHPFIGGGNMRNIETVMGFNIVPPPPPPPTPPPPPLKKQKIIRKMPMKMDTFPNSDYFNDPPIFQAFSNDHPVIIHKSYPDQHTGFKIHQNYNPHNVVQHIFTEEVQTHFK